MGAEPERPPLPESRLRRALVTDGGLWTDLRLVAETGSTNADAVAAAGAGAPEGLVVVAEHQRAGRGRAGRGWSSPPRAGLAVSVLLRPEAAVARWGWLPLLAAVAVAEQVGRVAGVAATVKWPNDLLVGGRKCGGILAEITGGAVVVGIGLNVTLRPDELPAPVPEALPVTSLALAGARTTDREALLVAVLAGLARWYGSWRAAGGDAGACGLREAYVAACATLGRPVRVLLPDGGDLTGTADTVDPDGRLLLRTADGSRTLTSGDVVHLRAAGGREGGAQPLR